jgi:heme-degrading monooxygenase HmoA
MFCTASHYNTHPANLEEAVYVFTNVVVRTLQERPGFQNLCLLSKADGELLLITMWDTEQQAIACSKPLSDLKIRTTLQPLLVEKPSVDGYKVQIHVSGRDEPPGRSTPQSSPQ